MDGAAVDGVFIWKKYKVRLFSVKVMTTCHHGLWVSHCIPPFLVAVTLYSVIDLELNWPTPLRS
jgi:hypothetical protein